MLVNSMCFQNMTFLLRKVVCVHWLIELGKGEYVLFKVPYLMKLHKPESLQLFQVGQNVSIFRKT